MTLDLRQYPELLDWIGTGRAFVFGPDLGRQFRTELERLPRGDEGQVDWSAFPRHEEVNAALLEPAALMAWASRMAFGRHGLVLVELGRRQAPVAIPFELAMRELWRVLASAPTPVFACGASTDDDGELRPDWSALLAFDHGRIRALGGAPGVH